MLFPARAFKVRPVLLYTALPVALLCAALLLLARPSLAATPKVGDKAPDFTLDALDKSKVRLTKLLKSGPVVLIVLRGYPGYQCPLCTAQVGDLVSKADKFTDAKSKVVLIYPGPADQLRSHADEFVRGKDLPANFYLLLDPDYAVVNRYALRWNAPNETAYPSSFVLNTRGKVLYAKTSHSHGDRAQTEDLLNALPK